MAALPYMQLYVAEYLADTLHLNAAQHGAYMLLLMNYWQRGKALPNSDQRLSVTARMTAKEWSTNKAALAEFFTVTETEWVHSRVEKDLEGVKDKSEANKANGKLGGRPRKPNGSILKTQKKPNGFENESESKGNRTDKNRTEETPTPDEVVFDHDMVATAVMAETGSGGMNTRIVLAALALNEIAKGRTGLDVKDHMIRQWESYRAAIPKLEWAYGSAEKFFGGGLWDTEVGWPWKKGEAPTTSKPRLAIDKL